MKKLFILFILCGLIVEDSFSQFRYDYGVRLGAANYLGDIGGKSQPRRDFVLDMHMPSTRWAVGGFIRKRKNKRIAYSATLDYLRIQDTDQLSTYFPRRARNLEFKNDMLELSGRLEYTLYYDSDLSNQGYFNPDMKIYVFSGVAGLYTNPQGYINQYAADYIGSATGNPAADYYDTWISLRKYKTEGQDKSYSPFTVSIPMGIGMYFTYLKKWRVGWEYNWRFTFTDYLDDISKEYPTKERIRETAGKIDAPIVTGYVFHSYDQEYINSPMNVENIPAANFWYQNSPRGNPLNNDNYMTFQVYVSKVIRSKSNFYKSKYNWMRGRNGGGVKRANVRF
ncbi:MAG: hypothetical protein FJX95_01615 [Bacteroidetes bacterium]|nr:hypothetical protein [Bacteroidota bacterium]